MKQNKLPDLLQLRKAKTAYEQTELLLRCSKQSIQSPFHLIEYHDVLLFILANPFNNKNYRLAIDELNKLADILLKQNHKKSWIDKLENSGLPYTTVYCQFGAAICHWLTRLFPGYVSPYSAACSADEAKQVLLNLLPGIEFHQAIDDKKDLWERISELSGFHKNEQALHWLLNLINERTDIQPALKDTLYDRLQVFISWKLNDSSYSRSFLKIPVDKIFYCKENTVRKNIASQNNKKYKLLTLTVAQKEIIIHTSKAALALYLRETDPVSYANLSMVEVADMGEGLQVALFSMEQNRQLSLESYIGYMAFSNGMPVAYGGGWIFGHRCKIGINIFPPYRGKGSDSIFNQILRLYQHQFDVHRFVVKPYQFGKDNPEGLKTGAFWFYYKMGFRPADQSMKQLALNEWKKITAGSHYRSPLNILKKFTQCTMELKIEGKTGIEIDADKISKAVSAIIRKEYHSSRQEAIRRGLARIISITQLNKKSNRLQVHQQNLENWGLILLCTPEQTKWNDNQRMQLLEIIHQQSTGNEKAYLEAINAHTFLCSLLKKTAENIAFQ